MADLEKIQKHIGLSKKYFKAAEILVEEGLYEPSLFDALHSLELAIKALLYTKLDEDIYIHQVAGLLGENFRERIGKDLCKQVAKTLALYNIPRYPDAEPIRKKDVRAVLSLAKTFLNKIIPEILEEVEEE